MGLGLIALRSEELNDKKKYFENKIEPTLSFRDRHFIRESYNNIHSENIKQLKPSELYARGLLIKTGIGWEILPK